MRLRKIGLAMVVLIICVLAGGLLFFYPKKVNNTPNKTSVSLSNMPKKDAFTTGWRNVLSNSSPVDNESFKKGIELACHRADELQKEECLQSTDLGDCFGEFPFDPEEISHILSLGPSLCKAKKTYACSLLLAVLPEESPLRKEYEEELREDLNSRCQKGSMHHCRILIAENKISLEEIAELNKKLGNNLQKKCYEGSTVNPRDCFLSAEFLNQSGQQEQALLAKQRMKETIHKKCENASMLSSDEMYCWLDVLDEPGCLYSEEVVGCKKRYEELSDTEKNSPAYTKFVAKVKDNCLTSASSCELLDRMLPPESADRVWAQNRWIQDLASKCQKDEQISDSACWPLYEKTKNTTDAHVQELRLDAKEHFLEVGLSACQKGAVEDCEDFINTLSLDEQSDFTEALQQARLKLVELSQESCQKKRDQRSCQMACKHGTDYLFLLQKDT